MRRDFPHGAYQRALRVEHVDCAGARQAVDAGVRGADQDPVSDRSQGPAETHRVGARCRALRDTGAGGPPADGHRACVGVRRGNDVGQDTRRDVEHVDRADAPQPDRLIAGCAHVQESVARRHHRPEGALGDRILRLEGAQQDAVAPVELHQTRAVVVEHARARGAHREVCTHHRQRTSELASLAVRGIVQDAQEPGVRGANHQGDQREADQHAPGGGARSSSAPLGRSAHGWRIIRALREGQRFFLRAARHLLRPTCLLRRASCC